MAIISGIDLSKFSSSGAGVYTIYNDDTQQPNQIGNQIVKLVVGFSKTGPFNTLTFINTRDKKTAQSIYGSIDRSLERRGSFFHRSLDIALESGPVLALNLLNLNNETSNGIPTSNADITQYKSFSLDIAESNGINRSKLLSSFYNKERLWRADRNYLLATRDTIDNKKLFNIVNLSQSPCSVIIKKSSVNGYDVTAKEWYGSKNIPSFVKEGDFISDYFIDVYIIDGKFDSSRYLQLSTDPIMGKYFDINGLKVGTLTEFLNLAEVNVRSQYTGCIIPNFKDKNNVSQFIEDIINRDTSRTGFLCAIDRKELDAYDTDTNTSFVDLIGHRLLSNPITDVNFLSYKKRIVSDFAYTKQSNVTQSVTITSYTGLTIVSSPNKITVTVTNANPSFSSFTSNNFGLKSYVNGLTTSAGINAGITNTNPILNVTKVQKSATQVVFDLTSPLKATENAYSGSFVNIDGTSISQLTYTYNHLEFELDSTNTFYVAKEDSNFAKDYIDGKIVDGDKISNGTLTQYIKVSKIYDDNIFYDNYSTIYKVNLFTDQDLTIPISTGQAIAFGDSYDSSGFAITDPNTIDIISYLDSLNKRYQAIKISSNTVIVPISYQSEIVHGDYLVGIDSDGNEVLTKILSIKKYSYSSNSPSPTHIALETYYPAKFIVDPSGDTFVERYKPIHNFFDRFDLTYLPGFSIKTSALPNNTTQRINEIYGVLESTNLFNTLIDPEMVNFRYIVDTFNGGLETNSKRLLSRLAKFRSKALGLLNTPSIQEFLNSTNPRFTNTPTPSDPLPTLNVSYIYDGGNLSEAPAFRYTLPEEIDGASYVGFFAPNIIVNDDGEISVPPAAYVSNNFVEKFTSGNPYKPTAGKRRGSVVGTNILRLERDFDIKERGLLESKGINPIKQSSDGSLQIYGNTTSFKKYSSTLNDLHARDTLIQIEIETENILNNYVFEYNDDPTRIEVKGLLKNYLNTLQTGFKAITFNDVIFDSKNNPDAIIRENIGLVDIVVQIPNVLRVFVNRITITRAGGASSGGFIPA